MSDEGTRDSLVLSYVAAVTCHLAQASRQHSGSQSGSVSTVPLSHIVGMAASLSQSGEDVVLFKFITLKHSFPFHVCPILAVSQLT